MESVKQTFPRKNPVTARFGAGIFLLLSLFAVSCFALRQNVKRLESCKFRVADVKAEKVEFISFPPIPKMLLRVDLEIENPNDTEVTVYGFDLSVTSPSGENGENELARIISKQETVVPAFSKKNVSLSLETLFEKRMNQNLLLVAAVLTRDILSGKDPNLRIKGFITYKSILGDVDLPVDERVKLQSKNKS
ncbi:hypothetical protein EHO60_04390 [Leptospira fletcheri]|uniref:Uncharacterized protein n=1 Tax=Leptospira fletcheri TaxID=2484981 RepID=A0A4R9GG16_9LEPT|nr:LEA type 2 family protein [Leptospira fletcheri]TGK11547.1 hypothetical protein EHO60_04390 [Leptospira fletcheri]